MSLKSYEYFKEQGAEFIGTPYAFMDKVSSIKALIFDWDGVFHNGKKNERGESSFSEIDSMGLNMLRFAYFLKNKNFIKTFIITGVENPTSVFFAKREHFDGVFFNISHKTLAADFISKKYKIKNEEMLFVFDDVLDLSLAREVGLRMMIRRSSSPLLEEYAKKNRYVDYITANDASQCGLRECSDLIVDSLGLYEETIEKRMKFEGDYEKYITQRNELPTATYTKQGISSPKIIETKD